MKLKQIVNEMKKCDRVKSSGPTGYRYLYGEKIKKLVIDNMIEENISAAETARRITSLGRTIEHSCISKWRRQLGHKVTGFVYGTQVRYDVATKAMAVKDYIVEGLTYFEIQTKYGVHTSTFARWVKQFRENFEDYIDAPEGIPYIVKEEKIVRGKNNIEKMIELLQKQKEEVLKLAQGKADEIDKEMEILAQAEEIKKKLKA